MREFLYHGWSSAARSKRILPSSFVLTLMAGMLLTGCSRNYDNWGRPVIIDASRRQGAEETIVARRSDVQSSHQTAPNGSYRVGESENPATYSRQNQYAGPTNPMGPGRQTALPYPIGDPQQAYNKGGYPGQPGQQRGGYNPTHGEVTNNQRQGTMGSAEQNNYPHSYASRQNPSLSQGYPAVNPNAASVGGGQNVNYEQRQSPPAGNYPLTITDTNNQSPGGVGQNPSPLISPNLPPSYGRSSNGMPEVAGVSVTEVQPSTTVGTQPVARHANTMAPSASEGTTRVDPGSSNGGFSSNSPAGAPVFPVPNPARRQGDILQPAVSVHAAGYAPDRIGLVNAITELERYQGANNVDLHTSLALHYLYLTQQPEKANLVLPETEEQANRMLELLDTVREKVAPRADFVISCMKICDKVVSFGNYQESKLDKLQSGNPQNVYVYCELENFQSKQDAEGRYLSDLHIDITLYDSRYNPKCKKSVPVNDTPSYSRRQDFFLIGDLGIPKLSPGTYRLRVEVEDKIARKRARPQEIVFEVKPSVMAGE